MFQAVVSKNQISVTQTEPITSGSVNAYLVQFEFSEEWADLTRVAVFKTTGDPIDVLLDDTNTCFMPWEVMTEFGKTISFGVYGTRGDEIVLPTIWAKTAAILEGVITGIPARDPEPTLLAQLMDKIKSLEEELDAAGGGMSEEQYQAILDKIDTLERAIQNITGIVPITQAEYDALSEDEKVDVIYLITDAPGVTIPTVPGESTGLSFVPGPGLEYDPGSNELYVEMFDRLDADPDLPVSGTLFLEVLGNLESILAEI